MEALDPTIVNYGHLDTSVNTNSHNKSYQFSAFDNSMDYSVGKTINHFRMFGHAPDIKHLIGVTDACMQMREFISSYNCFPHWSLGNDTKMFD